MSLEVIGQALMDSAPQKAAAVGEIITAEGVAFAKMLIPIILGAELTFCGIRIMFRQAVVEQFATLLVKVFICYIIVFTSLPKDVLEGGMKALDKAGKGMATKIVALGDGGSGDNPAAYWGKWLGKPKNADYKFGADYIFAHVFINKEASGILSGQAKGPGDYFAKALGGIAGLVETASFGYVPAKTLLGLLTGMMMLMMGPMQFIGTILTIAGIQLAGIVAPVFTIVGIYMGSYYAFYICFGFGIALTPLLFFNTFKNIWQSWLSGMVAIALVPFCYHILSAVGFVVMSNAFKTMFLDNTLGQVLADTFKFLTDTLIDQLLGKYLGGAAGFGVDTIMAVGKIFIVVGQVQLGSLIVSTFITSGCAFGLAAVNFAFKWRDAFVNESLIQTTSNAMSQVQGAIGTGVGQIYSEAFSKGAGAMGSFTSKLSGGLKGK